VAFTPTIENISPVEGLAGDTISITGVNYSTTLTDNKLKFNGVNATILRATPTKLTAKVPEATTGKITLTVKNSAELVGPTYTFIGTPTVTSISPVLPEHFY
jgi:uncharacterized protein (TIGR03437 family)